MTTVTDPPSLGSFTAVDTEPSAMSLVAALDEQASIPAIQRLRAAATELLGVYPVSSTFLYTFVSRGSKPSRW